MTKRFPESNGLMNKNFYYGQTVEIFNTTDPNLDGRQGKIVGKPIIDVCSFYIVDLGESISDERPDSSILMTEACLREI